MTILGSHVIIHWCLVLVDWNTQWAGNENRNLINLYIGSSALTNFLAGVPNNPKSITAVKIFQIFNREIPPQKRKRKWFSRQKCDICSDPMTFLSWWGTWMFLPKQEGQGYKCSRASGYNFHTLTRVHPWWKQYVPFYSVGRHKSWRWAEPLPPLIEKWCKNLHSLHRFWFQTNRILFPHWRQKGQCWQDRLSTSCDWMNIMGWGSIAPGRGDI